MTSGIRAEMLSLSPEAARALLPHTLVLGGVIVGLVLSTSRRRTVQRLVPVVAFLSLILAAFASLGGLQHDATLLFARTLASDPMGEFFNLIFLLSAAAVTVVSYRYLQRHELEHPEYYVLILLSALGMMFMASAMDLLVLFLGLELMSFSIYALVGFRRNDRRSNEAALKYFILGSAASAILLYGGALLYGTTQTLQLQDIWNATLPSRGNPIHTIGTWLLLVGFLFKVAAVPFHMWMPDVYEGAPTPVTAFMTTGVKVAAFGALLRLFLAFVPSAGNNPILSEQIDALLRFAAIATMVLGNLFAVVQTNLKRMLAYSSIAHTGYLLLGFLSGSVGVDSASAILLYLLTYSIMTMGAFSVLSLLSGPGDSGLELQSLAGLSSRKPGLAFALAVFLFSLAGLPPTAGFVAKYFLFYGAVQAGETPLVVIAILCSLASVYYYLRVLVYVYMKDPTVEWAGVTLSRATVAITGALVVLVIQIGTLPERWLQLMRALRIP